MLARSGLSPTQLQAVKDSPAYPALTAALNNAAGVEAALAGIIAQRTLISADDIAAVLHHRVDAWAAARQTPDNLVAGFIPRAVPTKDPDLARGLSEREHAIKLRAATKAEQAAASLAPWIGKLGRPPSDPTARAQWVQAVAVVAAYRDRWDIKGDPHPLGPDTITCKEQAEQRQRALAAARRAVMVSRSSIFHTVAPPSQQIQRGIEL